MQAILLDKAKGDITDSDAVLWSIDHDTPYVSSPLIYGDRLYFVKNRNAILSCYNAKTGERVYDRQRIPRGRAFTSSPWACNGKIFCLNEFGVTFVIQAGREFKLLHTNSLEKDELCMATPAVAGDKLILRSADRIYCIGKP